MSSLKVNRYVFPLDVEDVKTRAFALYHRAVPAMECMLHTYAMGQICWLRKSAARYLYRSPPRNAKTRTHWKTGNADWRLLTENSLPCFFLALRNKFSVLWLKIRRAYFTQMLQRRQLGKKRPSAQGFPGIPDGLPSTTLNGSLFSANSGRTYFLCDDGCVLYQSVSFRKHMHV